MSTTAVPLPLGSPTSPHRSIYASAPATSPTSAHAQALSDEDHCTVIPSPSLTVNPIQRARSGSRTYNEVQAEERELARRRTKSRERGERVLEDDDQANQDGLSYGELRAEMETLLSLRRRSMSQPLTVDPDLPPAPPAASSPLPPSITSPASSTPSTGRPKLSLTINTSHLHSQPQHPAGGPISPTAPSPAETGTLVRRKSSVSGGATRLPSEHPLPVSPPPLPPFPNPLVPATSPVSVSHFSSSDSSESDLSSLASPSLLLHPSAAQNETSPVSPSLSPSSTSAYQPTIIRSTSPSPSPTSTTANAPTPTQDLFWLPASLHPELAPQEFKAFIREQTRPEALARRTSMSAAGGAAGGVLRSRSQLGPNGASASGRIGGRRNSMLRGEYKPRADDAVSLDGGTTPSPVHRSGSTSSSPGSQGLKRAGSQSSIGSGGGGLAFEELTIRDLQRLEELAQRAEREQELTEGEGEGERLGRVLRRSLSLNPHRMAEGVVGVVAGQNPPSSSLPASYGSTLSSAAPSAATSGTDSLGGSGDGSMVGGVDDEDFDSPLIVPPPGQILRRNARTKIRKTGPGGEVSFGGYRSGGGSRLGGGSGRRARSSSDGSGIGAGQQTTTEDEFAGSSVESHDMSESGGGGYNDLRRSTSSLNSVDSASASTRPTTFSSTSPPIESPPLDGTAQYLEIADPAPPVPHIELQQPTKTSPSSPTSPTSPTRTSTLPPVSAPAPAPASSRPPPSQGISPASAEYDWASQHLPQPQPTPAKPQQQYSVHPSHGPSLPPPAPQAVPIPQPERERTHSVSSIASSKSSASTSASLGGAKEKEGKEKKTGWAAKLGLGSSSSDDKKKKGKGKEKDKDHARHRDHENEKSETVMVEDHRATSSAKSSSKESGGTSNSLFGGLFGRRRNDYDSPSSSSTSTSSAANSTSHSAGASAALAPPPPPTASGALLPNGKYANFYRLPIHVERAIYRLSHIKLANPRRPLYEQVLISNLMFWYLGLIQKPQPPPAAAPVPVPGRRNNSNNNNNNNGNPSTPPSQTGSSQHRPSSSSSRGGGGGGPGSRPTVQTNDYASNQNTHDHQNREVEHRGERDGTGPPYPRSNPGAGSPEYLPLPTSSEDGPAPRTPRKGQPRSVSNPSTSDSDDEEDNRPLAEAQSRRSTSRSPQRPTATSSATNTPAVPSVAPPIPISTVPKPSESPGFEVTSRRLTPPPPPPSSHPQQHLTVTVEQENPERDDRRVSVLSNKSLSEIYEAYSIGGGGAGATTSSGVTGEGGGGGGSTPPRGSSLQALGGERER
ncbi:hypothetical protein JCM11491_000613 [Sporobolomyces phaffii]